MISRTLPGGISKDIIIRCEISGGISLGQFSILDLSEINGFPICLLTTASISLLKLRRAGSCNVILRKECKDLPRSPPLLFDPALRRF